jgi:hypothetical protein
LSKHETGEKTSRREIGGGGRWTVKTLRLYIIYIYISYKKNRESMKSSDNQEIEHHCQYDEPTHEIIGSSYSEFVHTIVTRDLKKAQVMLYHGHHKLLKIVCVYNSNT